jgi:hypothetical protein
VEAIDLDAWIFTPAPRWVRDRENDGNIGDARIFGQVQASWRIIVLRLVFLYCSWQLYCGVVFSFGVASTPPFISKGVRLQGR